MQTVNSILPSIDQLNRETYPVKVLQFGSGNFLRGFVDWMLMELNKRHNFNCGVAVVQSISQSPILQKQRGQYTVLTKGIKNEEFVSEVTRVDVIQRVVYPNQNFQEYLDEALNLDLQIIISNTTEAGIQFSSNDLIVDNPAETFPGRLTQLLYHRFKHQIDNDIIILPTELLDSNGYVLKGVIEKYIHVWNLPEAFSTWLATHITFCNTLVDRIVSGFPKKSKEQVFEELGYKDELVVEAEIFHLWVIEGPRWVEEVLPLQRAGFNVIVTNDLRPYQIRKVRILNGTHTSMAVIGRMLGIMSVREAIDDAVLGNFIRRLTYDEIIPHITGDLQELDQFANDVFDRFRNPAIHHKLESISLNSFSKFKARLFPSLLDYMKRSGKVPERLSFVLAALIVYFKKSLETPDFIVNDSAEILDYMKRIWYDEELNQDSNKLCRKLLSDTDLWEADFTKYPALIATTSRFVEAILAKGIAATLKTIED